MRDQASNYSCRVWYDQGWNYEVINTYTGEVMGSLTGLDSRKDATIAMIKTLNVHIL